MRYIFLLSVIYICLFLVTPATAQSNCIGDADNLTISPDGGIILVGTLDPDFTSYDFLIIKYDQSGTQQWLTTVDGEMESVSGSSVDDYAYNVATDTSGNIYVSGSSARLGNSSTEMAFLLTKISPEGNLLWKADSHFCDLPVAQESWVPYTPLLAVDSAGNAIISVFSESYDSTLLMYNPDGEVTWNIPLEYYVIDMTITGNDAIFVSGVSETSTFLDKFSLDGSSIWRVSYSDTSSPLKLALDSVFNLYVLRQLCLEFDNNGWCTSSNFIVTKYNGDTGEIEWKNTQEEEGNWSVSTSSGRFGAGLDIDEGGSIFVSGSHGAVGAFPETLIRTYKIGPYGTERWVAEYESAQSNYSHTYSLIAAASGPIILADKCHAPGVGCDTIDAVVLTYDQFGNERWEQVYNGGYYTEPGGMVLDAELNIYVAVAVSNYIEGTSYVLTKYGPDGQEIWQQQYYGECDDDDSYEGGDDHGDDESDDASDDVSDDEESSDSSDDDNEDTNVFACSG
jgi:hypothetical protein